jgi:hypothetical protein
VSSLTKQSYKTSNNKGTFLLKQEGEIKEAQRTQRLIGVGVMRAGKHAS